jgi:hypothetical protein
MEPWAGNSEQSWPAATRLEDLPPRNGLLIEGPDSWRKIRETAAILYREDVRAAFVADWEHGGGTLLPGFSAARPG